MRRSLSLVLALVLCLLCTVSAAEETGILSTGDKGKEVTELKQRLKELRYITDSRITNKYTEKTEKAVREFQRVNGLPETGQADQATQAALFSDTALSKPWPTLKPLAAPEPTPVPDWPVRDDEGFLKDGDEYVYENDGEGLWIYLSPTLQITITARRDGSIPLEWFETDIRTRGDETFYTVQTDPEHPGKQFRYPYAIARQAGSVLAFTDDFFANRMEDRETVGITIRNGQIIETKTNGKRGHHLPNLDMMAMYPDGRLEVYRCNEHSAEELLEMGAANVFSFGPILIRDGEITAKARKVSGRQAENPRCGVGQIGPRHYLAVVVDGGTKESVGMKLEEFAALFAEKHCRTAFNLNGGVAANMMFMGETISENKSSAKNRLTNEVLGIGHSEAVH